MIARLVDRNGVSFFEAVDSRRAVWLRFVPIDPNFDASAAQSLTVERETYRRELWVLPMGPFAAPIVMDDGEIFDVVYRFDGLA